MTRLKAMDGTNHVFTVAVADGHLLLSVPVAAIDNHDDFVTWVGENCDRLNEVYDVAVSLVVSSMAGDRDSRNFEITVGSFPTVGTDGTNTRSDDEQRD